jgi:hypothetical protein
MKHHKGKKKHGGIPPNVRSMVRTEVRREMNREVETKFFDNNIGGQQTLNNAGTIFGPFPVIPQGITSSERIGDKVRVKKYIVNLDVYGNAATTTTDACRFIWFVWHPVNLAASGVVPTVALILQTAIQTGHFNWNESDQFTVLWDKTLTIEGNQTTPTERTEAFWANVVLVPSATPHRSKDGNPGEFSNVLEFTAAAATSTNQLYLLAICRSTLPPFFVTNVRTEFEDA